jgi:hypothetical protein
VKLYDGGAWDIYGKHEISLLWPYLPVDTKPQLCRVIYLNDLLPDAAHAVEWFRYPIEYNSLISATQVYFYDFMQASLSKYLRFRTSKAEF